ncbi:unnamed protein product [Didymodactylos carnosus]|uniref:Uncharacterized protein n=1 Tax=Didymodactylos carnosus TaxID=1234261 RepID=A0A815HVL2_9BILA|nr:unnamed protein product [Didymodactylos carnosus]CAF1355656.1 unnamed protein product [Didymodactylos carnosus]CAF3983913.1 unnamed protein product [Didymodactylos carnosus]CAF4229294.1 unnamed protein product [Didymodactylos carnosus]
MCSGRGLPVARRGRPFYSSKNDRSQSMCEKCNETLTQQQQHKFSSYSNRTKTLTVDNLALDSNDSPLFRNIFDEILGQDCSYSLSTNNPVVIADATALQQQHDVLELNDDNSASQKISTATTINGDLPTEIEFMLNETKSMDMNDYQSAQMLIWKLNVSGDVDLSYDTSSSPLTDDEKRVLVDEAVKKLNVALSSHKIPLDGVDVDAVNLTYAALNKTLQTLSANTL